MGCVKSAPSVNSPSKGKSTRATTEKPSKQDETKIKFSSAVTFQKNKIDHNQKNKNNNEDQSENESEQSTRRIKRNQNQNTQEQTEHLQDKKQHKQMVSILQEHQLVDDHDENIFKQKVQKEQPISNNLDNQKIFLDNRSSKYNDNEQPQIEQIQTNQDQFNNITSSQQQQQQFEIQFKDANDDSINKNNKLDTKYDDQLKTTEIEQTDSPTQKSNQINDNSVFCNALRQQTGNTQLFNSQKTAGSITMQTTGHRIQNSNIISSGIDYEMKRRELIKKKSEEIEELDEMDENNFEIGGKSNQIKGHKNNSSAVQMEPFGKRTDSIVQMSILQDTKVEPVQEEDEEF